MSSSTILTHTGRKLDLAQPRAEDVELADVARALSLLCRFGGHTPVFYSVADHSLLVEAAASNFGQWTPAERLSFLMHDAQEAYLGDVTRPLKSLLPEYRQLEERWAAVVREKFNLPWDERVRTAVEQADRAVLVAEQECLFLRYPTRLPKLNREPLRRLYVVEVEGGQCIGLAPRDAEELFLRKFEELKAARSP